MVESSLYGLIFFTPMKRFNLYVILLVFILSMIVYSCSESNTSWSFEYDENELQELSEITKPSTNIIAGRLSKKEDYFCIERNGKRIAIVKLSAPVIVSQALSEETWGYYQFPSIYRGIDGELVCRWQMKKDSYETYGDMSYGGKMSKDEGVTWVSLEPKYADVLSYGSKLSNGYYINSKGNTPADITKYPSFPKPINSIPINNQFFYRQSELPEELQGAYFEYTNGRKTIPVHAVIYDDELLRYSVNGTMPLPWWGSMKQGEDGTLIGVFYPTYYTNNRGEVLVGGVSTYLSKDNGKKWKLQNKIHYQIDGKDYNDFIYTGKDEGWAEPSMEILNDGTLYCVLRSGIRNPMFCTFSKDNGMHWSYPEIVTPNGVSPQLQLLGNGVLVMTSGRPGVQLRFCVDGDGKIWTEPIEMMEYETYEGGDYSQFVYQWETCGYTSLLEVDKNTFYMVYSDFYTKNTNGEFRKSILFRKVEVVKF